MLNRWSLRAYVSNTFLSAPGGGLMAISDPQKRREYMRVYQPKWLAARRESWFRGRACVNCGSKENLQVDHIDPKTKVSSNIWSWSRERLELELKKCQALCENCHHAKTGQENRTVVHGTAGMYQHQMCRCSECCLWKSLSNKKYRVL